MVPKGGRKVGRGPGARARQASLHCILDGRQSDAGSRTPRKSWVSSPPLPIRSHSLHAIYLHLREEEKVQRMAAPAPASRLLRSSSFVTTPPNSETDLHRAAFNKDSNEHGYSCDGQPLVLCLLQGEFRKYPRKCSELMGWKDNRVSRFDLETSVGRARVLSGARADLQRRPSLPGN